MRKLNDFKCKTTGQTFERFVNDNTNSLKCLCGADAIKQVSAPKCFSNTVGRSPSSR